MFTLMDDDNDGKISYLELRAGLRKVGSQLGEPEIKLLMEVVIFLTKYPSLMRIFLDQKINRCSFSLVLTSMSIDAGGC